MSNVVTFQDALQTLQSMFSHVSRAQIKQILLSHRGVMERAVDTLLQIPEPSPQALQEAAQTLDLDTKIRELEAQKLKFIQREQFLQAEEIKNRLTALRAERANRRQQAQHSHHQPHLQYEHTSQPAPTSSNVGTSSNNADARPNPFNTDFDELTPLFLRKRSRQRRELPEFFLRSPAFRRAAIQNKILASEMALQIHDEMHQEVGRATSLLHMNDPSIWLTLNSHSHARGCVACFVGRISDVEPIKLLNPYGDKPCRPPARRPHSRETKPLCGSKTSEPKPKSAFKSSRSR